MFPAEWYLLIDFIKSKNVLRALTIIPYVNSPHLCGCLHTQSLAASQRNVNVRCRFPHFPCFSFQFWLVMHYLSEMTEQQTLVMYSGHPLGLFPSHQYAPRLIITNGMVGISISFSLFPPLLFSSSVCWIKILFIIPECTTARKRIWAPNSAAFLSVQSLSPPVCWSAVMGETILSVLDNFCCAEPELCMFWTKAVQLGRFKSPQ